MTTYGKCPECSQHLAHVETCSKTVAPVNVTAPKWQCLDIPAWFGPKNDWTEGQHVTVHGRFVKDGGWVYIVITRNGVMYDNVPETDLINRWL